MQWPKARQTAPIGNVGVSLLGLLDLFLFCLGSFFLKLPNMFTKIQHFYLDGLRDKAQLLPRGRGARAQRVIGVFG